MLVLSRQRDQTIIIGDEIEITILEVRGDKVRIGINAPKNISVHRKEVYEEIKRANKDAAQLKPEDIPQLKPKSPQPPQSPENPPTTLTKDQRHGCRRAGSVDDIGRATRIRFE